MLEMCETPGFAVRMAQSGATWRKTHLRAWRQFRERSLESVAAQMGLHHSQLSKIERGLHPYNQHVLETAALEYDCSVLDLLSRSPNEDDRKAAAKKARRA